MQEKIKIAGVVRPINELDEEDMSLEERLATAIKLNGIDRSKLDKEKLSREKISANNDSDDNIAGSGSAGSANNGGVFKSANWLSDSELVFSLTNQVGGLVRALRIFEELGIGIKHVESRKSKRRDSEFEIFVDIDCSDQAKMKKLVHHMRHELNCLTKQEFERSSKLPNQLVRQSSLLLPGTQINSFNQQNSNDDSDFDGSNSMVSYGTNLTGTDQSQAKDDDRSMSGRSPLNALVMQPSVDYG